MLDFTPNPIAIQLGPIPVYWYGIGYAPGLAAAYVVNGRSAEASRYFGKAIQQAADRAAKARIIAAAAPLPGVLGQLSERAAGDGPFLVELARYFAEQGNRPAANAAAARASAWFEERIAKEPENSSLVAELTNFLLLDTTRWTASA